MHIFGIILWTKVSLLTWFPSSIILGDHIISINQMFTKFSYVVRLGKSPGQSRDHNFSSVYCSFHCLCFLDSHKRRFSQAHLETKRTIIYLFINSFFYSQFDLSLESNQNVEFKRKSVEFRNKKTWSPNFDILIGLCSLTTISGEIKIAKMHVHFIQQQ